MGGGRGMTIVRNKQRVRWKVVLIERAVDDLHASRPKTIDDVLVLEAGLFQILVAARHIEHGGRGALSLLGQARGLEDFRDIEFDVAGTDGANDRADENSVGGAGAERLPEHTL
jgi:hypothetical protein